MGILGRVLVAHGRERGHAHLLQSLGRVPPVTRARPRGDDLVEGGLVLLAQLGSLEPRIGGEPRLSDRVAQRVPLLLGGDGDGDPLVVVAAGLVGLVGRQEAALIVRNLW